MADREPRAESQGARGRPKTSGARRPKSEGEAPPGTYLRRAAASIGRICASASAARRWGDVSCVRIGGVCSGRSRYGASADPPRVVGVATGVSIPRICDENSSHHRSASFLLLRTGLYSPPPPPPALALAAPPPPPSTAAMLIELVAAAPPPSLRPRSRHRPPVVRPRPASSAPAPPHPLPVEPSPPPGRRPPALSSRSGSHGARPTPATQNLKFRRLSPPPQPPARPPPSLTWRPSASQGREEGEK
jgi:hypothetical protein